MIRNFSTRLLYQKPTIQSIRRATDIGFYVNPTIRYISLSTKLLDKDEILKISDRALQEIIDLNKKETGFLRIKLDSGGCHGYKVEFDLDTDITNSDHVINIPGNEGKLKVVFDNVFVPLIKGSTLDFQDELIGTTFRIVENPNAGSDCGCGISFGLK